MDTDAKQGGDKGGNDDQGFVEQEAQDTEQQTGQYAQERDFAPLAVGNQCHGEQRYHHLAQAEGEHSHEPVTCEHGMDDREVGVVGQERPVVIQRQCQSQSGGRRERGQRRPYVHQNAPQFPGASNDAGEGDHVENDAQDPSRWRRRR